MASSKSKQLDRKKLLADPVMMFAIILVLAPMAASRLVFSLCGLILLCIGGAQLLDKLRRRKLGRGKDKPDIIDAL